MVNFGKGGRMIAEHVEEQERLAAAGIRDTYESHREVNLRFGFMTPTSLEIQIHESWVKKRFRTA